MFAFLFIATGVILIPTVCLLLVKIAQAPEGYEDEAGFHFGKPAGVLRKRRMLFPNKRATKVARTADLPLPASQSW